MRKCLSGKLDVAVRKVGNPTDVIRAVNELADLPMGGVVYIHPNGTTA